MAGTYNYVTHNRHVFDNEWLMTWLIWFFTFFLKFDDFRFILFIIVWISESIFEWNWDLEAWFWGLGSLFSWNWRPEADFFEKRGPWAILGIFGFPRRASASKNRMLLAALGCILRFFFDQKSIKIRCKFWCYFRYRFRIDFWPISEASDLWKWWFRIGEKLFFIKSLIQKNCYFFVWSKTLSEIKQKWNWKQHWKNIDF